MNERGKLFIGGMWFMLALISLHFFQFGLTKSDIFKSIVALGVLTIMVHFIQLGYEKK